MLSNPHAMKRVKEGGWPSARDWNNMLDMFGVLKDYGYLDNPLPQKHLRIPNQLFVVQCWADGYLEGGALHEINAGNYDDHVGTVDELCNMTYRVKYCGFVKAAVGKVDEGVIFYGKTAGVLNTSPLDLGEGSTGMTPLIRYQLGATVNDYGKWICPPIGGDTSLGWYGLGFFDEDSEFKLWHAGEIPATSDCA